MAYYPDIVLGQWTQIDLQSAGDQALQIPFQKYVVKRVVATNITGTITGAVGGLYSAPNKGGTAIIAATQTYSSSTPNRAFDLTLTANSNITVFTSPFLYLSLTTGSSTPSRTDIIIIGDSFD